MINYLDIDEKITQNKKLLEFYYNNSQKTQSKFSILVIIYSLLSIYILQEIKYPFTNLNEKSYFTITIYSLLLIIYIILFALSIYNTYKFLEPKKIGYQNEPKKYYKDYKEHYEVALEEDINNCSSEEEVEDLINLYIKTNMLNELEIALNNNLNQFIEKNNYYNRALFLSVIALIFYLSCAGFIIFEPKAPTEIRIIKTELIN